MKLLGKPRAISRDKKWRVDCDYLERLPAEEREYMERFLLEYYLGNGLAYPSTRIHKSRKQIRELTVARVTTAAGDIVTAPAEEIARACAAPLDSNPRKRGTYMPSDYTQPDECPEDALIDALDRSVRKSS
jgi:hypothetical protein